MTGQTDTGLHGDSSAIAIPVGHTDDAGMHDDATRLIQRLIDTHHSERGTSMR